MSEPYISVIMAVRNEASHIARTLDAVLRQDYPAAAMEILVADGESDDATLEIIRRLDTDGRIRILTNPGRIQSAGLNLAIQQARGDIIVRVDGHTIIAPDYVRQCVQALAQTHAANVGGRMEPVGLTPMGKAIAAAGTTPFATPTAFHISTSAQFTDTVYLGAWPRSVLLALGGFDEQLPTNEDYELNYRIRRAGGRVYLSPAIRSTYVCRQSLGALAHQYVRYGLGKAAMLRKHPASLRLRQLVAPAFVAALALGLALAPFSPAARLLLLAMLFSYGMLAAGFSMPAARGQSELLWRLPLVYLTIHLAWGAGFWRGLLVELLRGAFARSERAGAPPYVMGDTLGFEERHGL
jgi:succinoglycan biosynthesis protein ExoA